MTVIKRTNPPQPVELSTNAIKNHLLAYWRFRRGWHYVATECWDEDVVVSNGTQLIFVEVKVSWNDYRHEFKKDKYHEVLEGTPSWMLHPVKPNRKYLAAPLELARRIAQDVPNHHPEFGVLALDPDWPPLRRQGVTGANITLVHKAKALHNNAVSAAALNTILGRMASELVTVRAEARP